MAFVYLQEFGLSALHYAAWNGNVECVETLCINDIGRDKAGLQRSCIDLKSCKGFTALHLAASDGVNGEFFFEAATTKQYVTTFRGQSACSLLSLSWQWPEAGYWRQSTSSTTSNIGYTFFLRHDQRGQQAASAVEDTIGPRPPVSLINQPENTITYRGAAAK